MKKLIAISSMLFALTFLSAAQTGGPSGQGGSSDQGAQKKTTAKGGGAALSGCLSGPNDEGAYVLKSGKRQVEVGGNDELSKHVGHTVKLHGSWAKSGAEIGEKENAPAEKKEGKEEKGERHFKVTSIDHVSETCPGGASGEAGEHHHKKSGTSQPSTPPK